MHTIIPAFDLRRIPCQAIRLAPRTTSQFNTGGSTANAGRKRPRLVDKIPGPEIRELFPDTDFYIRQLALEHKLEELVKRKRVDIQAAIRCPTKVPRKLRIYISHTFLEESPDTTVPTWELRIEGRLLDDSGPRSSTPAAPQTFIESASRSPPRKKFSAFFNHFIIELDPRRFGPNNIIHWERAPQTNDVDGFMVKRSCPGDVKCRILLYIHNDPPKFKLSPPLARLLGFAVESRVKILQAVWEYIKANKLQDPFDHRAIKCDYYFRQLFRCDQMFFCDIPNRIQYLLRPTDPIVLEHVIRKGTAGEGHEKTCYDVDVEMDDPVKYQMNAFLQDQSLKEHDQLLEQKVIHTIERIYEHKAWHDLYAKLADDPQKFFQDWLRSQSQDLQTLTEASGNAELERRADFFHLPEVQESVARYARDSPFLE